MVEWKRGATATMLVWGVALLVLGGLGLSIALLVAVGQSAEGPSTEALTGAILSGLTALVGLGLTLVGIWRAATSIEIVLESVQDAAEAAEREEAVRREEVSRAARDALEEFRARSRTVTHDEPVAAD